MKFGFIKTAALSPALRVADCAYNAQEIVKTLADADQNGIRLAVLPELSITGYTCGDLFLQRPLQEGALRGLESIVTASRDWNLVAVVGLPLLVRNKLFNCAAVVCGGRLLGIVPKTFLPEHSDFCEKRWFNPAPAETTELSLLGMTVPFGTRVLFRCRQVPDFCLAAEICEDLWAPLPPSTGHALAGATVIANLSASCEIAGKSEYRRQLVAGQSARLLSAYVYANPGYGESTTDLVFSSHNIIAENGEILAEKAPFSPKDCITELDMERLTSERTRSTSFLPDDTGYTFVDFDLTMQDAELTRPVPALPFVPTDTAVQNERCELILNMQAAGLAKRLEHAHAKTAVLGISGGLDSALALMVTIRAMKMLERPLTDIYAVSMPCFGTSFQTRSNAEALCNDLRVRFEEIEINNTVLSHFADIGHNGEDLDVTYENAQARVRTLVLMDIANRTGGLVVGTGDLSELALGWATYNGDHMSMYGVNAGVPKTLVQQLVRYMAMHAPDPVLQYVLTDILQTPVSPELLPLQGGQIAQHTQKVVGPYELHDFFLYFSLRYGYGPAKIFHLAKTAFRGRYPEKTIKQWMQNFFRRFFAQQFKRSCLPDGPKVGNVGLSPRGAWRMPSDACADLWLREVDALEVDENAAEGGLF